MSFGAEAPIGRRKRIFALRKDSAPVSGFIFIIYENGFDKKAMNDFQGTKQKVTPLIIDEMAYKDAPLLLQTIKHERFSDKNGYKKLLRLFERR